MPETCRKIVGDGSIPPPTWNRSLLNHINEKKRLKAGLGPPDYAARDELAKKRGRIGFPNPLETLKIATEKEGFLIMFYAGIVYAGFFGILAGLPSQLKEIYGYDDLKVGLMFLPISGGSILAAFTQGKLVDWSFKRQAKKMGFVYVKSKQQDLTDFPIEKARLLVVLPMMALSAAASIIYGWILHYRVSIAGPCVVLFIMGFALIASTQSTGILIVDINPGLAGTATASFNLIRCLLGAGATAVILPMTNSLGLGWSYTLIGLIYIALSPCLFAVMHYGPRWRRVRKDKKDEAERKKKGKEDASARERGEVV